MATYVSKSFQEWCDYWGLKYLEALVERNRSKAMQVKRKSDGVVFEAFQWTGDLGAAPDWFQRHHRNRMVMFLPGGTIVLEKTGLAQLFPKDWVLRSSDGEVHEVLTDVVFSLEYEPYPKVKKVPFADLDEPWAPWKFRYKPCDVRTIVSYVVYEKDGEEISSTAYPAGVCNVLNTQAQRIELLEKLCHEVMNDYVSNRTFYHGDFEEGTPLRRMQRVADAWCRKQRERERTT